MALRLNGPSDGFCIGCTNCGAESSPKEIMSARFMESRGQTEFTSHIETMSAIIVFGPDYSGPAKAIQQQGPSATVFAEERAQALSIPATELSPCTLCFAHWVPGRKGHSTDGETFQAWVSKLLNGLQSIAGLSESDCKYPEKKWHCDVSSGTLIISMTWKAIESEFCLRIARGLEQVFQKYSKPFSGSS